MLSRFWQHSNDKKQMINSAKNTNSSAHCERKFEILIDF